MTLEEIATEWTTDCENFNHLDWTQASLDSIKQAGKYARYKSMEAKNLRQLKIAYSKLRAEKEDFLMNPTIEVVREKGWEVPSKGRILKTELPTFLAKDPELVKLELAIGSQDEKVELLKEILKQLNGRSFTIRNMIEDRKYKNGG